MDLHSFSFLDPDPQPWYTSVYSANSSSPAYLLANYSIQCATTAADRRVNCKLQCIPVHVQIKNSSSPACLLANDSVHTYIDAYQCIHVNTAMCRFCLFAADDSVLNCIVHTPVTPAVYNFHTLGAYSYHTQVQYSEARIILGSRNRIRQFRLWLRNSRCFKVAAHVIKFLLIFKNYLFCLTVTFQFYGCQFQYFIQKQILKLYKFA